MDYKVSCSLCLRDFGFPIVDPNGAESSRWAYRLIGPFALPDFANGGYAAALAIRFFADVVGRTDTNVTWSAGQELSFQSGKKIEADFILWYQRTRMFGTSFPTEVIFGEVKSFGREVPANLGGPRRKAKREDVFKNEDIARMKLLAESFPGAVLVFATMSEAGALTKDEVSRLRKLAEWGRECVMESRRTRAPVIVLTGTELFAGYSLKEAWENRGGRHKDLSSPGYVELDHLHTLADLTQQLYLGMQPYHEWAEAKSKARRARQQKGG
ncbi:hypothetical protein [Paraburkholderia strydomiana]